MNLENVIDKEPLSYFGKVRIFLILTENKNKYDIIDHEEFDDCLLSNAKKNCYNEILTSTINMTGYDDYEVEILKIVKNYKIGDIVEIVADAHFKFHYLGDEINYDTWFENVKHCKANENWSLRLLHTYKLDLGEE